MMDTRFNLSFSILALVLFASCSKAPDIELLPIPDHPGVSDLAAMLDAGTTTSSALVVELLERAEASAGLNAYITLDKAGAIARAAELDEMRRRGELLGPMHGVPVVVKDNIHVAGLPNTAGTPGLAEFVPKVDNAVVAALKAGGAIVLAKTNLHELAFGITSDNAAFGAVANPHNTTMFAGGSSGGTAAAVAAGMAPAGLGTDTGGSVRIPAALTGTVGFRPSMGRYESSAVTPISHTRDTVGLIARNVADVVLMDRVVHPGSVALPNVEPASIRLGVARSYFFAGLDTQTAEVVDTALQTLAEAGVQLIEAEPGDIESLMAASAFPIALYEVGADLPAYLDEHSIGKSLPEIASATASPDVQGVFAAILGDSQIDEATYAAALAAREELRALFGAYFAEHELDGLIFPTTMLPARPIEGSMQTVELNGEQVPTFPAYIRNTEPATIAALPGISLPIGMTADGLPVGIEVDSAEGDDLRLLAIALVLEKLLEELLE